MGSSVMIKKKKIYGGVLNVSKLIQINQTSQERSKNCFRISHPLRPVRYDAIGIHLLNKTINNINN